MVTWGCYEYAIDTSLVTNSVSDWLFFFGRVDLYQIRGIRCGQRGMIFSEINLLRYDCQVRVTVIQICNIFVLLLLLLLLITIIIKNVTYKLHSNKHNFSLILKYYPM